MLPDTGATRACALCSAWLGFAFGTLTLALTLSRCVLPDMSALLCDGPVLVEAGLQVGGDVARCREI